MTSDFLPQFRHRLFEWLQFRLTGGRTPFRRVEETPRILTGGRLAAPDLVLWINRDSLLAGAMILIPPKGSQELLEDAGEVAASLGLRQFVTWEARAVNIWAAGSVEPGLLKSWPIPGSGTISTDDFAVVFEQLLQELRNSTVAAVLPPAQLPPAYFANLCRQVLRDLEQTLAETARVSAGPGQTDACIQCSARDKGWMTLWRLLALLWYDRLPPRVNPERLDYALGYALSDPTPELFQLLAPADGELPLPENAAIRFHHLVGRLVQLGWQQVPERAGASLRLLLDETAQDCGVATTPLEIPPGAGDLLVNHLPPQPLSGATVVAPLPCLAGLALTATATGDPLPARTVPGVGLLGAECRPPRIVAVLDDLRPLSAARRRQRLAALRSPWPYRRFQLAASTPAWIWDALHLGGLATPEGRLELTLPHNWTAAPGAAALWRVLGGRLSLAGVQQYADGRQTLSLVSRKEAPDTLKIRTPDGTVERRYPLADDADVVALADLCRTVAPPLPAPRRSRSPGPALAARIAGTVFRDGVPRFPEHYLRRIDPPPLQGHDLPGPLQTNSHFFDRIRLTGPDGTFVDCDNPADAEALCLASLDGRDRVALPVDPLITMQLIAAYRSDLQRLWQALADECRRHHTAPHKALALARQLWRERSLPPVEER